MHHTHKWIGAELEHMLKQSLNVIDRVALDTFKKDLFKKDLEEGCKKLDYGTSQHHTKQISGMTTSA
jgi:hypothetical protein